MDDDVIEIVNQILETEDFFKKAKLIQYLQSEKKIRTKHISEALSIKPAYLCHITRLNKLPEIVIDGYYAKLISLSHLFIIARLKEQEHMINVYEKALTKNLTVLDTEELVREYLYQIKSDGEYISAQDLGSIIEQIKQKHKNIFIKVVQTRIKAKVVIEVKGNLKKTSQTLKNVLDILSH